MYFVLGALAQYPSRSMLLMGAVGSFVLTVTALEGRRRLCSVLLPTLLFATGGLATVAVSARFGTDRVELSTFYGLRLDTYRDLVPSEVPKGAVLEPLGNGLLAAAGDGGLFYLEPDSTNPARSALTSVRGTRLAAWRGDLFVASLRARALFRVRTIEDRVLFAERVCQDVGGRIRDLTEMTDGRIALSLDGGAVVLLDVAASPAPADGALGTARMPAVAPLAGSPPDSQ